MNAIVILPVYQPEPVLEKLVEEICSCGNEVILVDDGSDEDSQPIFWKLAEKAIVLHHDTNKGKGAAIKTALAYIQKEHPSDDVIGVMDADGQHLTKDMERLIFKAREKKNALVLGTRQVGEAMPLRSRMGNKITRQVFHLASGVYISDTQSGLRAFHSQMIDFLLSIPGERYEYETGVLYRCAKEKIEIIEVPIDTIYKDKENSTSHFHTVLDSIRIYKELLKFAAVSFSSFLLDYILFILFLLWWGKSGAAIGAANVAARGISAAYNYSMNAGLVFGQKASNKSLLQYVLLAGGILILNSWILSGYVAILGNAMTAKVLTEMTLFVISFTVQKQMIFKKKKVGVRKQAVS